jgi:hypothetical protein
MLDKYEFTNDEIAKVLGVDAIRWCFWNRTDQRFMQLPPQYCLRIREENRNRLSNNDSYNGSDGSYGDFFKTMDQGIMASTDDIVRSMMRKVSKTLLIQFKIKLSI